MNPLGPHRPRIFHALWVAQNKRHPYTAVHGGALVKTKRRVGAIGPADRIGHKGVGAAHHALLKGLLRLLGHFRVGGTGHPFFHGVYRSIRSAD